MRSKTLLLLLGLMILVPARAADPPTLMNYQGVLRDAADKPRAGTFDMTFRFFNAQSGGSEILVDAHTGGGGNPVTVGNGLFSVQLGGGTVTDGSGAGTYTSLSQVFRDFGAVWLDITVGAETLSPRIRVQSSAYALNASNLQGLSAASFLDVTGTGQTKSGRLTLADPSGSAGYGLTVSTPAIAAVYASNAAGGGKGYLGYGNVGVQGEGSFTGGFFADADSTGSAFVGYGDVGVQGSGDAAGGVFWDNAGNNAQIGGAGRGVWGSGVYAGVQGGGGSYGVVGGATNTGGYFFNNAGSEAFLGTAGYGITANGASAGGYFASASGTAYMIAASGEYGIRGYGTWPSGSGGYFEDWSHTGQVWLGDGDTGILAKGNFQAGEFRNNITGSYVRLAWQDAFNSHPAGFFFNPAGNGGGGTFVALAIAGSTWTGVYTNGSKNFVQNHPFDPSRVVVYSALEGGEAGTYTRGSGRLLDGEARLPLDPTFALTTDPDIGLTAVVTPRAGHADLYVVSVSTSELVVRAGDPAATDVAFDYLVNGLRLGFEKHPSIMPKDGFPNAPVPPLEAVEATLASLPEDVRRSTPAARLSTGDAPLSAARGLIAAIDSAEQAKHGWMEPKTEEAAPSRPEPRVTPPPPVAGSDRADVASRPSDVPVTPTLPPGTFPIPIGEPVESGDVLSNDVEDPGTARRATADSAAGVMGIVAGAPGTSWVTTAPLALPGTVVLCRVDASYGAIAPSDLLMASPTTGVAMRAGSDPKQGTVVGKALEALEAGTAMIRVLVMSR